MSSKKMILKKWAWQLSNKQYNMDNHINENKNKNTNRFLNQNDNKYSTILEINTYEDKKNNKNNYKPFNNNTINIKTKSLSKFFLNNKKSLFIPSNNNKNEKTLVSTLDIKSSRSKKSKNHMIYPYISHGNHYSNNSSISKKQSQLNTISIHNKSNKMKTIDNSSSNSKYLPKKNTNYINFVDRNKIRNTDLISMKLFDDYVEDLKMSRSNSKSNNLGLKRRDTFLYQDIKSNIRDENYYKNNSNYLSMKSNFSNDIKKKKNYNNKFLFDNYLIQEENELKDVMKKMSLHQLMELNPYHAVSKNVKYSNSIEMKKISEKLGNIHGASFNIKAKSQRHFFRGQSYKNKNDKRNRRVINSFQVTFNTNLTHRGGLVWRILNKFKLRNINILSSFRQACKFKAYLELWKYHSMVIEKLLVNYEEFKWFYEKEKLMKEEVFNEFLECKKLQEEVKEEITFCNKVYLAFDELGTGEINLKVFFLIMEITSKSNNNLEKLNFITSLVEDYNLRNEEKSVNIFDMYELFKSLILFENAQKDIKYLYEAIKTELNNGEKLENNIYVKSNDVYNFLLNNKIIHKIIQGFKTQYKFADINYIDEVNSSFNSTVRNVKKFLNEQKEVLCDNENNYYKFEQILKSIQNKNNKKEKTKNIEEEFENNSEEEYD